MEVEATRSTQNVKVELGDPPTSLPLHATLAHALALVVACVISVAVTAVLADGMSVIKLKPAARLPRATNPALVDDGIDYRLDEVLGPTYGIGLHHDQAGRTWTKVGAQSTLKDLVSNLGIHVIAAAIPSVIETDALHPVAIIGSRGLSAAGLAAMSLGFVADAVAMAMILFHAAVLAGLALPHAEADRRPRVAHAVHWLLHRCARAVSSFGVASRPQHCPLSLSPHAHGRSSDRAPAVIVLACAIYTAQWSTDNEIILKIKLSEHFHLNYGFYFAITGYLSALLVFCSQMAFTALKPSLATDVAPGKGAIVKTLCGVSFGLLVGSGLSVIALAANGVFEPLRTGLPTADMIRASNPCAGQKPKHSGPGDSYFNNVNCWKESLAMTLEQAGGNVTRGFKGTLDAGDRVPITVPYSETDLCPVNVHWHLGAEHLSVGEFDDHGSGPGSAHRQRELDELTTAAGRKLAAGARLGFRCHKYDSHDARFADTYNWQHCTNMHVGETYEIHWPHSAAGACGTPFQYQTPFYDGVFCNDGIITIAPLNTYKKIGVQSQTFTVINDEAYYADNLFGGMLVDAATNKGQDIAMYTGSTTGTSRDNSMCSRYTPITWQVDRKCHLISASSFDKLCYDMSRQWDDMSGDYYPHGSRIVWQNLTANNQQSRQ